MANGPAGGSPIGLKWLNQCIFASRIHWLSKSKQWWEGLQAGNEKSTTVIISQWASCCDWVHIQTTLKNWSGDWLALNNGCCFRSRWRLSLDKLTRFNLALARFAQWTKTCGARAALCGFLSLCSYYWCVHSGASQSNSIAFIPLMASQGFLAYKINKLNSNETLIHYP